MSMPTNSPDLVAVVQQAFPGIGALEIEALCRVAVVRTYPPDYVLCQEGAVEHIFYIVAAGQAAVSHRLGNQEKHILAIRDPGEFFGEMALIENKPRAASVTTLTETTVLEISEAAFNDFLGSSPNMALAMIRRITANLRAADQATIVDLSCKNVELAKAYRNLQAAQADLVAKERMERELEIAGEVQRSLLPTSFPQIPGYAFAGGNVPARHVGGDLYDVIQIDDEHVGLLMADVSDKGVHAALIMAVTRTLFLSHARRGRSPTDVALAVHNGLLEASSNDDMFVTVFYGVLHWPTRRLRYVRAGQDKPLLFRAGGAGPVRLEAEGRFLGMLSDLTLEEREIQLQPGDVLVAYSDGVPDAVNEAGEAYGVERLVHLIERHCAECASAEAVSTAIFEDVFAFRAAAAAFDDITVLAMRCNA